MSFQNVATQLFANNPVCKFYDAQGKLITSFTHSAEKRIRIEELNQTSRRELLLDMHIDGLAACIDFLVKRDQIGIRSTKDDVPLRALATMAITTNVQKIRPTVSELEQIKLSPMQVQTLLAHLQRHASKYPDQIKSIAIVFPELLRNDATDKAVLSQTNTRVLAAAE